MKTIRRHLKFILPNLFVYVVRDCRKTCTDCKDITFVYVVRDYRKTCIDSKDIIFYH